MIDGNTAALNAHQREKDVLAENDAELERLQQELANDFFDGYVTDNYAVIDEIEDSILTSNAARVMRSAMTEECQRPVMGRGVLIYEAYMKLMSEECLKLAKRYDTRGKIEKARNECDL